MSEDSFILLVSQEYGNGDDGHNTFILTDCVLCSQG